MPEMQAPSPRLAWPKPRTVSHQEHHQESEAFGVLSQFLRSGVLRVEQVAETVVLHWDFENLQVSVVATTDLRHDHAVTSRALMR